MNANFMFRLFDIFLSLLLIIVGLPLVLVICYLIILFDGFPVFFLQKRVGMNGKIFTIVKFRTMKPEKGLESKNSIQSISRITYLGAGLRKSRLDELPQLINVLFGQMSIVGPRPHSEEEDVLFEGEFKSYKKRKTVKPGITGLAQINGFSGPIGAKEDLKKRIVYDLKWVKHRSFILYLFIFWKTFLIFPKLLENTLGRK